MEGLRYTRREHAWSCLKAPLLLSKQVERAKNYSTVFILFFYSYRACEQREAGKVRVKEANSEYARREGSMNCQRNGCQSKETNKMCSLCVCVRACGVCVLTCARSKM